MSPLQMMVCYLNSPAVLLSIYVTGRAQITSIWKRWSGASGLESIKPLLRVDESNVVAFRSRNSNVAA